MIDRRLILRIAPVGRRLRRVYFSKCLAVGWGLVTLLAVLVILAPGAGTPAIPYGSEFVVGLAVLVPIVAFWLSRQYAADPKNVAREIETRFPDLKSRLITAVEQTPALESGRLGFLQETLIGETLRHGEAHDWRRAVGGARLRAAVGGALGSCILLALALVALFTRTPAPLPEQSPQVVTQEVSAGETLYDVEILPGDTEAERGTSLSVVARFEGALPPDVTLEYRPLQSPAAEGNGQDAPQANAADVQQYVMSKSLSDPVFAGRIAAVRDPLQYRVHYGQSRSRWFRVSVFEYPQLQQADAELVYPEYTRQSPRRAEDVRRVSAVEGTRVNWTFSLNKDVDVAELESDSGQTVALKRQSAEPAVFSAEMTLTETQRFQLKLVDEAGRENRFPPEIVVTVIPNQAPDLKLVMPARDVRVSPLEELTLKANAYDDFGLRAIGLTYSVAGSEPQEVVLGESVEGRERTEFDYLLAFESLEAEPDQLVSYHFWAEDVGPDGQPRRTLSDMFFAEVRHFEEIFREGQQPPGGQQQQQQSGGAAQQAEQLAELQKQIINATWKLIRRETAATPSARFHDDAVLVQQSQASALEQLGELGERIQDSQSLEHLAEVRRHMGAALDELTAAADNSTPQSLPVALAAEQAAYQALLKLRAREHEVIRSQQSQMQQSSASQSSANRSQQQLQQLELKNDQNRYETQRTATQEEDPAAREMRQVLNRLKELAQRQEDLNKRLKELQTALEEAKTEQERQEIERQLKRLREEEQEILRDADELADRMGQPQNQEQMAEDREKLEQTRENIRQASEALEQGEVSKAAASGTRAERELKDLRDDLRKRSSERFSEEMREMRREAQELAETEEQIGERLRELSESRTKSLRDTGDRKELLESLGEQKQNLDRILDQMQQTIQDAEETEPLLANELYETLRETQQSSLNEDLETTREFLDGGFLQESRQAEQDARQQINNLRDGIEQAAESVLGDESEAIERALAEVRDLKEQLQQEINREDPRGPERTSQNQREQSGQPQSGEPQSGEPQSGQPQSGQPQSGQPQSGEPQSGEPQSGQPQSGQPQSGQPQSGEPQSGEPQSGEPQSGQPQSGQPQSGEPQSGQQQSGQQQSGEPQSGQPQSGEPQSGEPQTGEPQSGEPQSGQPQSGQPQSGQAQSGQQQSGQQQSGQQQSGGPGGGRPGGPRDLEEFGPLQDFVDDGTRWSSPLTGEDYRLWSERMRDVEEIIDDPELRSEAARIRDRARQVRIDLKRHSRQPNWDLVRTSIFEPLSELENRLQQELLLRQSRDALVPIDRDPVPPQFSEHVRNYFEELGSGR